MNDDPHSPTDADQPDHEREPREDRDDGSDHGDAAPLPFAPHEDDDTPLGDTDQHSDA